MKSVAKVPFINVRDVVVFPGMYQALMIGRAFSVKAILSSREEFGGRLAVFTQKRMEQNERPGKRDMFTTGTLCKVVQSVSLPDGSMKVLLKGERKITMNKIEEQEQVRFCVGATKAEKKSLRKISEKEKAEILGMLKEWNPEVDAKVDDSRYASLLDERNLAKFLQITCSLLNTSKPRAGEPRTAKEILKGPIISKKINPKKLKAVNALIQMRQELLEEADLGNQLTLVKSILSQEIPAFLLAPTR